MAIITFIQGIIVGFGAIMPGISGGTLCAAFQMYYPIMNILSDYRNIKTSGIKVFIFLLGGICGFIGLSSIASYLMDRNSQMMTCMFIGLILGTLPSLYNEVEDKSKSLLYIFIGFILMMVILEYISSMSSITLNTDFMGYYICGILWGLSFIVPGLSSSTLLLYFGIYNPMLKGIAMLDMNVLIPLALGLISCIVVLSRVIMYLYKHYNNIISFMIIGIIIATIIMIIPMGYNSIKDILLCMSVVVIGTILSYFLTIMTNRLKE